MSYVFYEIHLIGPVRCRIQKHQEARLDEIGTELIKTTINRMENDPNEFTPL